MRRNVPDEITENFRDQSCNAGNVSEDRTDDYDFLTKCAENEIRKSEIDMIYLASCVLNGVVPKRDIIEDIDANLFGVCQKHGLTVCVACALESAGVHDSNFEKVKKTAGKHLFESEKERKRLEKYIMSIRKRLNL